MVDSGTETQDTQAPSEGQPENKQKGQGRKAPKRSAYLFPAYGFGAALDIARRIEEGGGGSLSEATLAVNMGLSVKSSGFRLKTLTARQFQLLTRQGETLTTTPIAKAILKPTSEQDAINGYRQAFLSIQLFRAVAERFRGQPLPQGQTMRNILEREFRIEASRVQVAERMMLDSARDAQLLTTNGDKVYLTVLGQLPAVQGQASPAQIIVGTGQHHPPQPSDQLASGRRIQQPSEEELSDRTLQGGSNVLTFSLDEIAALDDQDFSSVWNAMGTLVKARRKQARRTETRPFITPEEVQENQE